ncbi:MAG: peptidyl-prolyl cis-trans isomerase C [Rickettsiales bacterium]|jgi:peptidyl-prolyl cis-trans isomerase C
MKKKTKLIIILLTISVALAASIYGVELFHYQKNDKVVAKINGQKIYQSELEDKLNTLFQNIDKTKEQKIIIKDLPLQLIEALAQDVYLQRELYKIAEESSVAKDLVLQKQIEDYKKATIRKAYLDSIVAKEVNDQAVKDQYAALSSELYGKKELSLRHILVESEIQANRVLSELQNTKSSFAELAIKYSKDTSNATSGGDLGYVIPDNLDEEFSAAIIDLEKNQVSKPIKTKYGWHIVKVENIRDFELPDFENLKQEIKSNLKQDVIENLFNKIVEDIKIEIVMDLNPKRSKEFALSDKVKVESGEENMELKNKSDDETQK